MKNKMKNRIWILVLFLSLQAFTQEKTQSPFNSASYTNPDLPIAPELIQIVNEFIKSL